MQADAAQIREILTGETHLAHQAMRALRTTYEGEQEFVEYVDGVLRPAGYRLLGAFSSDREPAGAVAGFCVGENLAWGHYLYVDDLSTSSETRRQGLAGALLELDIVRVCDDTIESDVGQLLRVHGRMGHVRADLLG